MSIFTQHTDKTAPSDAAVVLSKVKEKYGFFPNLASYVAESPQVLDAIMNLSASFDGSSLTPQEKQIVLLTVSSLNGCSYCKTVHTALGRNSDIDSDTLKAVVAFEPLKDSKLNALRNFTQKVVEERGWVKEDDINKFLDAGFTKAQVFEVVLGMSLKMLTNYSNHLAGASPNPEFLRMAEA